MTTRIFTAWVLYFLMVGGLALAVCDFVRYPIRLWVNDLRIRHRIGRFSGPQALTPAESTWLGTVGLVMVLSGAGLTFVAAVFDLLPP